MEKLISMTEFVLNVPTNGNMEVQSLTHQGYERYQKCLRYANFLSQPLQLGFFIPCDENNVPLEEPENWQNFLEYSDAFVKGLKPELYRYQQAKERCYFEGCEIMDKWCLQLSDGNLFDNIDKLNKYTIEDLIYYGLTLTQTAKNRIL